MLHVLFTGQKKAEINEHGYEYYQVQDSAAHMPGLYLGANYITEGLRGEGRRAKGEGFSWACYFTPATCLVPPHLFRTCCAVRAARPMPTGADLLASGVAVT